MVDIFGFFFNWFGFLFFFDLWFFLYFRLFFYDFNFLLLYGLLAGLISSILVTYVAPNAGGSGIPEIKAYLNGVSMPQAFTFKTWVLGAQPST